MYKPSSRQPANLIQQDTHRLYTIPQSSLKPNPQTPNQPTQSGHPLTLPNRRARERVLIGMAAVQVDEDTGGILLISAGESDLGTGVSIAAAGDAHLAAAQVELRAVQRARSVQGDLLDAQEVVAAGEGGGEVDEDFLFACRRVYVLDMRTDLEREARGLTIRRPGPAPISIRLRTNLLDLEPHVAVGFPGVDVLAVRHARHVVQQRADVLHRRLQLEADGRAGGHALDVGGGTALFLVAADLARRHVGDGAVRPLVGRAAHVLPFAGDLVVGDEIGEGVWCC